MTLHKKTMTMISSENIHSQMKTQILICCRHKILRMTDSARARTMEEVSEECQKKYANAENEN